jgi:translocation and assembly module TamB
MSKGFRKLVYVVGTLAGLAAVALGVLSTSWFQRTLERRIVTGLENLTGGRVEIGEFHFRPVIFQVVLRDLVIHGTEPPGEPPLFTARLVVARLNPGRLLRRQLHLRSLDWDHAEVHLRTNPDGSTNLPGPRTSAGQELGQLMDWSIARLTLAHSSFFWNDQQMPFELRAGEVAILLRRGHGDRYVGSLTSSAATFRSPQWSAPPLAFTTRFELSRTELAVTSLAWQTPGIRGQCSLTLRMVPAPQADFSFQASGESPALAQALKLPQLRTGSLHAEGQGAYQHGEWSARGRVQARQLTVLGSQFNSGPLDASSDYSIGGRRIELSNLRTSALGGTAQGKAEISLLDSTPQFHLHVRLFGLNLAALLQSSSPGPTLISHLRPSSRIDGTADAAWSGSLESLQSEFDLQFRPAATRSDDSLPVSGHVRGTVELARGLALNLREASFQTPQSSLTARGTLVEPTYPSVPASKLAIAGRTSDFEEWRRLVEILCGATRPLPLVLKSPATFSGEVSGTINQPEIHGRLEVGGFEYHGWTWDKLSASVALGPEFADVSSGRLEHATSSLSLQASTSLHHWRITPDSTVHVATRAQRTPLEGLKAALGVQYPVSGSTTGQLDLDGTSSSLTGSGVVRIEAGTVAQEPFDSFVARIHVTESVWNLEEIQLAKGPGRITGELRIEPSRRSCSGELHGTGFLLTEFKHWALPANPSASARGLEGQASFDLRGEITPEDLQLHSIWSIQEIRIEGTPIGDFRGQLDGQGQRLRVQGEQSGPSGTFHFSGESQAKDNWLLDLEGEYSNLRLDPWIRLLLNGKFSALVAASGSFRLTGPLPDPARLELRSQAQTLEISLSGLKWKNDQPIDVRFASQELTTGRFRMRGPSTDLEVDGSVRFAGPTVLSLNAQGMADATLLTLLDPSLQATGRSQLKLRVSGSPAQPVLNGTLDVQDVSLSYQDLPFRFSGLNGEIQLEGERATVRSLRGVSGGGTVSLGGFVTLTQTPRFDLEADLDQVRVRYPTRFTSVLNGNLRLMGTAERGQLQGELLVRQMFASENINWLARMIEAGGPLGEQMPGVPSPLAAKIRLDIRVTSAPPIRLELPDLHVVGDLDVRLQGTLANPVQVGAIHFLSGEAVFRGNRYKLIRGDLGLTNPFRTQAILDLEAQTRVQRYELTLDISGPLDRLKFAYRSDPPLPTADILSLLALGYSRQQQEMSTAAGHPLPSVGASALLSEALSSQVTGRIQRLFGVSRIKIDPNVGATGYGSGARVTVEQRVAPDLTLTYVTNTAASQYRVIQFDWAISDNISLIGVRDQNGIFGLEVKFRQRFK